MRNRIRLLQNLIVLALVGVGCYAIYNYFFSGADEDYQIEDTPLRVEMVRSIAEISTVSYKDEVVQDSVEFYQSSSEQLSGNAMKLTDPDFWKYGVRASAIKRRLTIIVRGEVRYGFDLTKDKIKIQHNADTIWVTVPPPKILDVLVTPSETEIFQENGDWSDHAVRRLETSAVVQLKRNAEQLDLASKSKHQLSTLLQSILPDQRKLILYYK